MTLNQVLASALMDLQLGLLASASEGLLPPSAADTSPSFFKDGFKVPKSPAVMSSSRGSSGSGKRPVKRPPPLGLPTLELPDTRDAQSFTLRRSPRFTPQKQKDDLANELKKQQSLLLAGAAWDAPIKRRLDFPSPVPLSKPRAFGMPRVAVIRKQKSSKSSKRKRKMTQKAESLAWSRTAKNSRSNRSRSPKRRSSSNEDNGSRPSSSSSSHSHSQPQSQHFDDSSSSKPASRTTEKRGGGGSHKNYLHPEDAYDRPGTLRIDAGNPMSPGRKYLLRSFITPVSPLLRSKKEKSYDRHK
jgi:hypothetical protein